MKELHSANMGLGDELRKSYASTSWQEKTQLVFKNILKAIIACAKAQPQIEARFGPFFNSSTGLPNPDPDFAAEQLNKQYSGGFVKPKAAWAVLSQAELF